MMMHSTIRYLSLLAAFSLVIGCNGGDPKPTTTSKDSKDNTPTTSKEPDTKNPPKSEGSAEDFGRAFLNSLGGGKAKPEDLAPSFKRMIAPPVFEEEKRLGYSDTATSKWLEARGAGLTFIPTAFIPTPNKGVTIRGDISGIKNVEFFALRIEKNPDGGWLVQWFNRTATKGLVPMDAATPELLRARDAAQNFLDSLTGGDLAVAEALMTLPLKEQLGGSPTAADKAKGLTYDASFLKTKLSGFKNFTTYKIATQTMQPGDSVAQFGGELSDGDQKKQNFSIRVTKDATGLDWVVEEFKE